MGCDWLNMRSFHCPYLEGIGCNADFLSRFTLINETLIFAERDKFKGIISRKNVSKILKRA